MNFDKNTGVIEMIMESLTPADEGTFTFQLQDGKATNQSSLVLIGDGMFSQTKRILKLFLIKNPIKLDFSESSAQLKYCFRG